MAKKQKLDLGEHEGRKITGLAIDVRGAGGGLGQYLEIDPARIERGQTVLVLLETVCIDVGHPLVDLDDLDESGVMEKPVLKAVTAQIVNGKQYETAVAKWKQRAELETEKREGVQRLDLLGADHAAGKHALGLEDGCPECDREAALVADEALHDVPPNPESPDPEWEDPDPATAEREAKLAAVPDPE